MAVILPRVSEEYTPEKNGCITVTGVLIEYCSPDFLTI